MTSRVLSWIIAMTFPRFDGHLTYGHSDRGGNDDPQTETTFHR